LNGSDHSIDAKHPKLDKLGQSAADRRNGHRNEPSKPHICWIFEATRRIRTDDLLITNKVEAQNTGIDPKQSSTKSRKNGN
jgi:hypothetical protein